MAKQVDTPPKVAPPTTIVSGDTIVPRKRISPTGFAVSEAPKKATKSRYKGREIEADEALRILDRQRAGLVTFRDAWGIVLFFIFVAGAAALAALVEFLR